jgi:hypothetical protein
MPRRTMPRIFSQRTKYPSLWPVQVSGMPASRQPWPEPGAAATDQTLAAGAQPADEGELTALPWMGLHYRSEGF